MQNTNVFLAATKQKLRFEAGNGHLSVEDLWDLSLKKLDEIAIAVDSALGHSRKSFLDNPDSAPTAAQRANDLRLEVLKEVIATKQAENSAKLEASKNKARREFLEKLAEKKKIDALESLSLEEIEKQLAELHA